MPWNLLGRKPADHWRGGAGGGAGFPGGGGGVRRGGGVGVGRGGRRAMQGGMMLLVWMGWGGGLVMPRGGLGVGEEGAPAAEAASPVWVRRVERAAAPRP